MEGVLGFGDYAALARPVRGAVPEAGKSTLGLLGAAITAGELAVQASSTSAKSVVETDEAMDNQKTIFPQRQQNHESWRLENA